MQKLYIITGAAGFIGLSFLEKIWNLTDHHILAIDKMGYATQYNTPIYKDIFTHGLPLARVDSNINDVNSLKSKYNFDILTKFKFIIIDFASESHVDNSIANPFSIYTENASIPANLLQWIGKENWHKIEKYYHISTDEVYGELEIDKSSLESHWFNPRSPLNPNNPYSASKAAQDCFLMSMQHTFNIPVRFIRMANQIGIYQHPEKMLPASILRVLNDEPIKIYGNGRNVRQWTPVSITVDVIYDYILGKIPDTPVLHIANHNGLKDNNEIVDILTDIFHKKDYTVSKTYIEDRKGHDLAYAITTTPEVKQYFNKVDLTVYIDKIVKYFIKNKSKYIKDSSV